MTNMLILQFEYTEKDIYNNLVPWLNDTRPDIYNDIKQKTDDNSKTIYYQVGLAIEHNNSVQIVTPFNIYTLYSSCKIINYGDKEIELSLNNYCYYTRLASYTIMMLDKNNLIEDDSVVIKIKDYHFKINNLNNACIKTLNKDIIVKNMEVVFKNVINENIYPFVWLEADISKKYIDNINETLISGSYVYKSNNILIGIVYNVNAKVTIIPMITVMKFIINNKLSNIFFDYHPNQEYINNNLFMEFNYLNCAKKKDIEFKISDDKLEGNIIISQTHYIDDLEIGDTILSIDGKQINEDGEIFSSELKIYIPLHTYIWYSFNSDEYNFVIYRNKKRIEIKVKSEKLIDKINLNTKKTTELLIKNNIIFCKPNLLMFEWLSHNDIYIKNYLYIQYKLNPYYIFKQKYLFVGLNDAYNHQKHINKILSEFNKSNKYIDIFTILNVNGNKISNIENCKSINRISLCDIDETKIVLKWN